MFEFFLSEVGWIATHRATEEDWAGTFSRLAEELGTK
jgi:hypothetical protein